MKMKIKNDYYEFMKINKDNWAKKEESKGKNKYSIDETEFIKLYKRYYELEFIGDDFYTKDGKKSYEEIGSEIHNVVKIFIRTRIDSVVSSILKSLYRECYKNDKINENAIHTLNNKIVVKNGIIKTYKKETTSTRINAEYLTDFQEPTNFLKYLKELFTEEDITIFQEYLGYCLVPNTSAHKGLFVIGSSGDGKSEIIGKTFQNLFCETITGGDLIGMLDDRFGLGNIINKLVNFDDELSDGFLSDSNNFKKLISGGKVRSEKKYKDVQLIEAFCRIIALGNHMVRIRNSADIDAIKRRVLILKTKSHSKDRKTIANLFDKYIKKELNQIFMWALEGLVRLQKNNWQFSFKNEMEEKVEKILLENVLEEDTYQSIVDFIKDDSYIILNKNEEDTTSNIYKAYVVRCLNSNKQIIAENQFNKLFPSIASDFNIKKSEGIYVDGIRIGRGYKNVFINKGNILVDWK